MNTETTLTSQGREYAEVILRFARLGGGFGQALARLVEDVRRAWGKADTFNLKVLRRLTVHDLILLYGVQNYGSIVEGAAQIPGFDLKGDPDEDEKGGE